MKYTYELQNPHRIYHDVSKVVDPLLSSIVSNAPNAQYATSTLMDMTMYMYKEDNFVAPCVRSLKRRTLHAMSGGRLLADFGPARDEMLKVCVR